MSIIAASLYRNGKRVGPVSLDEPVRCATDRSEFVWIGLFEPSEAELRQLQENYDLHPLAIEDALPHTSCQSSTSMATSCSWWRAQPISLTAKSAMVRPRSSLAIPSSSAFATDRSARIPGSGSS